MIRITLSRREKIAVFIAVVFIGIFSFTRFLILPLFDDRERLERMVAAKNKVLMEMQALRGKHDAIGGRQELMRERFLKRPKGFTLFPFLGRLAGEVGIKDHISYMKPSSSLPKGGSYKISLVEMKLKGISLKQLIAYMYKAESPANMVTLRRVSISKEGQEGSITAVLQVETLES